MPSDLQWAEWLATEKVHVEMGDNLARIGTGIGEETEAGLFDSLASSKLGAQTKQAADDCVVLRAHVTHGRKVLPRDQENVDPIFRMDVPEREDVSVLVEDIHRNFPRRNLAEDASRHSARSLRGHSYSSRRRRFLSAGISTSRLRSSVSCTPLSMFRRITVLSSASF